MDKIRLHLIYIVFVFGVLIYKCIKNLKLISNVTAVGIK